jgi:hypothetical protein
MLIPKRASLPPVVVLSFYQSDTGAQLLGTLGYLSAIISILTLAMQPRAKFLANLYANVLAAGLAAAIGTLIVFAAVKARLNTTPPLPPGVAPPAITSLANVPYNSSASAVSAVFFFFSVSVSGFYYHLTNAFRSSWLMF